MSPRARAWRIVFSPMIPQDLPSCYHSSMRNLAVLVIHLIATLAVGRCLPERRRECRRKLQPPLSKGQPPHATFTQSSCERRSQDRRKHLRNRVSPLRPAPGTQSSHRGHCPSAVSADLADPAPGSPLRRTRPRRHQTIETKAHDENDPATPESGLSDRTTESSTQPSTSAVIFEPGVYSVLRRHPRNRCARL
jgi:hypothetical protein